MLRTNVVWIQLVLVKVCAFGLGGFCAKHGTVLYISLVHALIQSYIYLPSCSVYSLYTEAARTEHSNLCESAQPWSSSLSSVDFSDCSAGPERWNLNVSRLPFTRKVITVRIPGNQRFSVRARRGLSEESAALFPHCRNSSVTAAEVRIIPGCVCGPGNEEFPVGLASPCPVRVSEILPPQTPICEGVRVPPRRLHHQGG